jgi:hypothetical protein
VVTATAGLGLLGVQAGRAALRLAQEDTADGRDGGEAEGGARRAGQ